MYAIAVKTAQTFSKIDFAFRHVQEDIALQKDNKILIVRYVKQVSLK